MPPKSVVLRKLLTVCLALGVTGCSATIGTANPRAAMQFGARAPEAQGIMDSDVSSIHPVAAPQIQGYRLTAEHQTPGLPNTNAAATIELSFENAPIAEVATQLLGEAYGATVLISPEVSGTITVQTGRPVRVSDIPDLLSAALALQDIALIENSPREFQLVPTQAAPAGALQPRVYNGNTASSDELTIFPVRHRSASELSQILQPFARGGAQIATVEHPPSLLVSGPPAQRHAIAEMIEIFDVDWLSNTSIALIPLRVSNADAIAAELSRIIVERRQHGAIDILALPRLDAIVAFAQTPADLQLVEDWVARLDVRPAIERDYVVRTLTNSDATEVAEHLNDLFGGNDGVTQGPTAEIRADVGSNRILIAASPELQHQIDGVVDDLDRAPDQVLIEAMIVEVVLTDDLAYGVQWFLDTRDGGTATSTSNRSGGVSSTFPGFSYTYSSDFVRAALSAISSLTQVETLSSPQIVVRNNASASVQVGDQVPIVTQTAVSVSDPDAPIVNSVQFRDTGVNLTVTARIDPSGLINLDVAQEVSSVAQTTTSGIDSPTIQQRRLESNVSIYDGESVVLGGLIRTQTSTSQSGIPGLQSLPGVGGLFSDTSHGSRRTELLVFLTPRLIRSREDAVSAADELRARMRNLRLTNETDVSSQ